ncbi:PREDICTED: transmembrane protein 107-like [Priapulus caudatus]|uniref:Transmembrane protein 107 n=1 Tax=Priapulus caudatus TaxID=37621 RepID=A0ABM1DPD8_PRICU|nr:PREDICTED: transmembrane protein 107-like [Priapulus caudatus]XP_014661810.1 PREDICTED: transmembrane protein 107-like [Priapulus caudatus]
MGIPGIVPARFLTLIAHLVITWIIFWSRGDNILACLPQSYSQDEYNRKDMQLVVGLSVSLGLIAVELVGFFTGISMFMPTVALVSIASHASGSIALAYFIFDVWDCDLYWWVFSFCSCTPALLEISTAFAVIVLKKGL